MMRRRISPLLPVPFVTPLVASDMMNLRAAIRGLTGRFRLGPDMGEAVLFGYRTATLRNMCYGQRPISRRLVRRLRDEFWDYRKARLRQLERDRVEFEAEQQREREFLAWAIEHLDELNRRLDDGTFGQHPK